MRKYAIKHIDAFTRKPWCGNPAGVVADAGGLSDADMQNIAREMNLSETAFVVRSDKNGADLRLRWFTPTHEVDLCGHATIATFHALSEDGLYGMTKEGEYRFTIETRSGLLGILVEKTSSGDIVEFELPLPNFEELTSELPELEAVIGLQQQDRLESLPSVKDAYAYIPIRSLKKLHSLEPSIRTLSGICDRLGYGGVCVFTLETVEESSAVHSRFFAPSLGVDEDPVTGSANGPLGAYLGTFAKDRGLSVPFEELADGRTEFIGEQGDAIGRPGRVTIRIAYEDRDVNRVWIAGHAVTVMDSTLHMAGRE